MAYTYKGKTYKTKALMQKAQGDVKGTPTKNTGSFFDKFIKGDKFKNKKGSKASIASGKSNADATKKMYAAESMFKSAKNRDDSKVKPGKAQPFGSAFKSAKEDGKKTFSWKGKFYTTQTKSELEAGSKMGKFKNRFDQTGKDEPKKKESIFSKFKSSKTGSEFFKKLKKKK